MQRLMQIFFDRCGQPVRLEGRRVRALFQGGHSRSLQSLERIFVPLGEVPRGQYVCYFPAKTAVKVGDSLQVDAEHYSICRVEGMRLPGSKTLYQWTLCMKKGGAVL